ncbi:hypothetical protein SHO565_55840 [Streptomyces sp. HO565]
MRLPGDEVGDAEHEDRLDVLLGHEVQQVPVVLGDLVGTPRRFGDGRAPDGVARGHAAFAEGCEASVRLPVVTLGSPADPADIQERRQLLGVGRQPLAPDSAAR